MPEPRLPYGPAPASIRDADAACRGIGVGRAHVASTYAPPAAPSEDGLVAGAPADRLVVREAVREATATALTRQAHEQLAQLRRTGLGELAAATIAPDPGSVDAPSPELLRSLAHLRATVTRLARERRGAGVPVERVIPEVKQLVREAAAGEGSLHAGGTLAAQVVTWTISAYYDRPEPAHVARFV